MKTYSTPRRLAVLVEGVRSAQTDVEEKLTGPSWTVAFKDGAPTKAAEAFAKKAGVVVDDLKKVTTAKGEYVGATITRKGVAAPQVLAGGVAEGSAVDLLGEEYVLAIWEAGAVCAAGALGCRAARILNCCPLGNCGHRGGLH